MADFGNLLVAKVGMVGKCLVVVAGRKWLMEAGSQIGAVIEGSGVAVLGRNLAEQKRVALGIEGRTVRLLQTGPMSFLVIVVRWLVLRSWPVVDSEMSQGMRIWWVLPR